MQIIVVSNRLRPARTVNVDWRHIASGLFALSALMIGGAMLFAYMSLSSGAAMRLESIQQMVHSLNKQDTKRSDSFVKENINALAVKLGEMQAQLTRLDAIGERVASLAGLKIRDLKFGETPGRGGAFVESTARSLSMQELARELDHVSARMDNRGDTLKVMEEEMLREKARRTLLPSAAPVDVPYQVSGFGHRIDPFTGRGAMHEGIDFAAPVGTPILAAAGGIVVTSETHPQYGHMVELDHGNGLVTRYAHASRLHAKVGELVKRGQKIAEVGSTGYSTGPHLHFEVREKGVAQNPARFLTAAY